MMAMMVMMVMMVVLVMMTRCKSCGAAMVFVIPWTDLTCSRLGLVAMSWRGKTTSAWQQCAMLEIGLRRQFLGFLLDLILGFVSYFSFLFFSQDLCVEYNSCNLCEAVFRRVEGTCSGAHTCTPHMFKMAKTGNSSCQSQNKF